MFKALLLYRKMTDPVTLAWFAGFYEGEGWVSNDKHNGNRCKVGISQNDRAPLDQGQAIWGGNVIKRVRQSPATGSTKVCTGHDWNLSQKPGLKFLNDIRPYMRIPYKIKQLEDAIVKSKIKPTHRYKCSFCESTFSAGCGRRRHELKEHLAKGAVHKCEYSGCSRTFKSRDSLRRHHRINHI